MSTRRWLDAASDADGFERAVLESGLDAGPPPAAEQEVWRNLLLAIPPPLAVPGAPVAAKITTLGALGKGFLLGVAGTAAVAAVGRWVGPEVSPSPPAASAAAPGARRPVDARRAVGKPKAAAAAESPEASSAAPITNERAPGSMLGPSRRATSSSAPLAPGAAPPAPGSVASFAVAGAKALRAPSRLEEEAALLAEARAELRAGELLAARGTLDASREKFSAPELLQEREALLIELLYRSGERTVAATRAHAFLRRYPESPHGELVRTFAGSPP